MLECKLTSMFCPLFCFGAGLVVLGLSCEVGHTADSQLGRRPEIRLQFPRKMTVTFPGEIVKGTEKYTRNKNPGLERQNMYLTIYY